MRINSLLLSAFSLSLSFAAESQFDLDPKFESFEGGSRTHEQQVNQEIVDVSIGMLKKQLGMYPGFDKYPRDAHAKSHGCLKGKFVVNNKNLAPQHRLGIFKSNKSFETWIRFSNNDEKPVRKDNKGDLRGIAMKLLGVPGTKIMDGYEQAMTQDFLLYGSKEFFIKNNADYVSFIKGLRDGNAATTLLFEQPLAAAKVLLAQQKLKNKVNLFDIDFFSATPVRLGKRNNPHRTAFKYAVSKCSETKVFNNANKKDHNYMRKNLMHTLRVNKSACFDFKVQLQKYPDVMPIEDSSAAWPEKAPIFPLINPDKHKYSPYVKVGRIYFNIKENRNMNSKARKDYCEDLSFNPWHTIPEHKPLGRTMRMRRDVYRAISDFRRIHNNAHMQEPESLKEAN